MKKKGQGFIEKGAVFLALWIIAWIIWAIFLDGLAAATAGCLTGIAVVSVITIAINRG